jgi:hypothetical protein
LNISLNDKLEELQESIEIKGREMLCADSDYFRQACDVHECSFSKSVEQVIQTIQET